MTCWNSLSSSEDYLPEAAQVCKVNCAHAVNGMMSRGSAHQRSFIDDKLLFSAVVTDIAAQEGIDTTTESIIIVFTVLHGRPATDQTIISPRKRHTQPAATGRQERDVPGQRFLRSRRSAAGQVR